MNKPIRNERIDGIETRQRILDAIAVFWENKQYPPSIRDLCEMVHGTWSGNPMSTSTMSKHLDILQKAGKIERELTIARSIRLVEEINDDD